MAYALGQLEKHSDSVLLNHSQCWYWEAQVRDAQYLCTYDSVGGHVLEVAHPFGVGGERVAIVYML